MNMYKRIEEELVQLFTRGATNLISVPKCINYIAHFKELDMDNFIKCIYGYNEKRIYLVYDNKDKDFSDLIIEGDDTNSMIYTTKLLHEGDVSTIYVIDKKVFDVLNNGTGENEIRLLFSLIQNMVTDISFQDVGIDTLTDVNMIKITNNIYLGIMIFIKIITNKEGHVRTPITVSDNIIDILKDIVVNNCDIQMERYRLVIPRDTVDSIVNLVQDSISKESYNYPGHLYHAMNNSLLEFIFKPSFDNKHVNSIDWKSNMEDLRKSEE